MIKGNDYEKWVPIKTGVSQWGEGNKCPKENFLNHMMVHIIVLYISNSLKVDKKMKYHMLHVQKTTKIINTCICRVVADDRPLLLQ